jgi:hypothetical protein
MVSDLATMMALGYVGPGAGVGLLAALIGVLAALGSALLFVILWPLRMLRRRRQQARQQPAEPTQAPASTAGQES